MGSLDIWGAIAASILIIQCVIFNLVFVGLALGIAFGSRWIRLKTDIGFQAANKGLKTGQQYALKGQSQLAAPFVRLRAKTTQWRMTRKWLKG